MNKEERDFIKEKMKIAYSNTDIENKLNNKVNVLTYTDLIQYNNINDILGNYGNLVILVELKDNYGHWICCFKRNNNIIEVFDSYGLKPDDQLNYVDNEFKKNNNMNYPYLSKLLYYSKYNIEYNQYKLQEKSININTCGRWVVERIKLKNISIDDFYKLYKSDKDIKSDELVTLISLI